MEKQLRWFVIVLAWIGAIAILGGLGWGGLFLAFKDFAGGNCTDTEQKILASPNGSHSIKSFHRVCGGKFHAYFVYLSTGNPNKGYEYTPIAQIDDVAPGQVSIAWNGADTVEISYPASAKVEDVYAKLRDVLGVFDPLCSLVCKEVACIFANGLRHVTTVCGILKQRHPETTTIL